LSGIELLVYPYDIYAVVVVVYEIVSFLFVRGISTAARRKRRSRRKMMMEKNDDGHDDDDVIMTQDSPFRRALYPSSSTVCFCPIEGLV
jgi:hypothetical protein